MTRQFCPCCSRKDARLTKMEMLLWKVKLRMSYLTEVCVQVYPLDKNHAKMTLPLFSPASWLAILFFFFVVIPVVANEKNLNETIEDENNETIDESEPQMEDVFDVIDLKIRVCCSWLLVLIQVCSCFPWFWFTTAKGIVTQQAQSTAGWFGSFEGNRSYKRQVRRFASTCERAVYSLTSEEIEELKPKTLTVSPAPCR